MPDEAVIQDVRGHEEAFKVVPAEVEGIVAEANAQIDDFNAHGGGRRRSPRAPSQRSANGVRSGSSAPTTGRVETEDWPRLDVRGVVIDESAATTASGWTWPLRWVGPQGSESC